MATTTYYLSAISLVLQYFQNLGLMNAGGTVATYVGGSVGTPVTTYTDSTGLVANPNPMTLNSAGRPASSSGAPVAFWVPAGTVVQLQVFDASGSRLVFLDNVPAINDLTNSTNALQTLLASAASSNITGSGPVAGVDLVANAVKSYDVFADVRAANMPTLATGQTLNIEVQGGQAVADGLGGLFYWNPTSSAADDGRTVLKPNTDGGVGRWLRYYPLGVAQIFTKTADQGVASSTALVNDTALVSGSLVPGTYLISLRAQLLGTGGTGQGWKLAVAFAGGVTQNGGGGVVSGNNAAVATATSIGGTVTNAAIADTSPADFANLDFVLVVTSAAAVQVQFAQNSSSANATTMKAGSTLTVTRVA